jgi:hypothetical protein
MACLIDGEECRFGNVDTDQSMQMAGGSGVFKRVLPQPCVISDDLPGCFRARNSLCCRNCAISSRKGRPMARKEPRIPEKNRSPKGTGKPARDPVAPHKDTGAADTTEDPGSADSDAKPA